MSTFPPFYPPAYPTEPPLPLVSEQLLVNGVDLGSYAFMTTDVSTLLKTPPRRGENVVVPGRHGRVPRPGKKFDAGEYVLPMWVVGAQPDGSLPTGGHEVQEFWRRHDQLLRLFYADEVTLLFRRADGMELFAQVEVIDVMDFTRHYAEPLARVNVAFTLNDPFWAENQDTYQIVTGTTGVTANLVVFKGSTAPIADARVTFFGPVNNPRISIGDRWLQFNGVVAAGRELVLECKHFRASSGSGAVWSPPHLQVYREPGPAWLEVPPSADPLEIIFTHTGGGTASVEISGRRKFLTV